MENKRIGILTFHNANNYGAVLQAYALQHYIELNISKNVEILNYRKQNKSEGNSIFKGSTHNPVKNLILNLLRSFQRGNIKQRSKKFDEFREKYLHLSERVYDSEFSFGESAYNYYIVGSDQVFNPQLSDYRVYYLSSINGNCKKLGYAPSFGISSFSDEITNKIGPLLRKFDALSCREEIGAKYISNILNNDIPVVMDPVFLLSKEEWKDVAIEPETKKRYLLVYCLTKGKSGKINQLARLIAKKKKLTVVTIGSSGLFTNKGVNAVGPREFIGYFINADFVVTDSFHGTSFSLIFGKRVLSIIANKNTGSRIENIMNIFGRNDDVIRDIDKYKNHEEQKSYLEDRHLELLEVSKKFLNKNLS